MKILSFLKCESSLKRYALYVCTERAYNNTMVQLNTLCRKYLNIWSSQWRVKHNVKMNLVKGSFTIIDIYESVHSVRFLMTPSPLPKSVL